MSRRARDDNHIEKWSRARNATSVPYCPQESTAAAGAHKCLRRRRFWQVRPYGPRCIARARVRRVHCLHVAVGSALRESVRGRGFERIPTVVAPASARVAADGAPKKRRRKQPSTAALLHGVGVLLACSSARRPRSRVARWRSSPERWVESSRRHPLSDGRPDDSRLSCALRCWTRQVFRSRRMSDARGARKPPSFRIHDPPFGEKVPELM